MPRRKEDLIAELLDEETEEVDTSLGAQARQRAEQDGTPKTMTPWEWEEWYRTHDTPSSHLQQDPQPSLWQRIRRWLRPGS